MRFLRSFHVLTYGTVLWAFLTLLSTGEIHIPAVGVYAILYAICVARLLHRAQLPHALLTAISVLAFGLASYGWFYLGERMYSVTYFLLYLQLHKLFTARKGRDMLQVYGLSFFQVLAASVSTTSVFFAPFLLVYMLLIVAAMMTFTMKRDAERTFAEARAANGAFRPASSDNAAIREVAMTPWLGPRLGATIGGLTLALALMGSAFFWIIPRASDQHFISGLGAGKPRGKTGFADSVSFGDVGRIQQDPTIIMRVELSGDVNDRPPLLRIRGTSLDDFDGRQWATSPRRQDAIVASEDLVVDFLSRQDGDLRGSFIDGVITLEPENSGYLFLLDQPRDLRLRSARKLFVDLEAGSARLKSPSSGPVSYEVTGFLQSVNDQSAMRSAEPETFAGGESPSFASASLSLARRLSSMAAEARDEVLQRSIGRTVDERYLQMPDVSDMETVRDLAQLWTQGLTSDEEKALEIQRRLQNEFDYSLEIDFSSLDNHLSHFLRVRREGHCEYFATAMVLMLRSIGVQARIVNGYLTDEWAEAGTPRYLVRQEHAHSWVEARFSGRSGWVTFDPTPAAGLGSNRISKGLYHRLTALFDAAKLAWYSAVIDYDSTDQRRSLVRIFSVLSAVAGAAERAGAGLERAFNVDRKVSTIAVLSVFCGGVGLLLAFIVIMLRRAGVLRLRPEAHAAEGEDAWPPRRSLANDYFRVLDLVEIVFPRTPSSPPMRYATEAVDRLGPEFADFRELTAAYYRVRYSGAAWPDDFQESAEALRRRLENRLAPDGPGKP